MTVKKVVYVAGPFRAANSWEIELNIRKAETVALEVWKAGHAAICPHANNRFYQGAAPDDVWLDGDLAILERCDAIMLCPGWEASEGTNVEIDKAREIGIPIFDILDDLMFWLEDAQPPRQRADVLSKLKDTVDDDEFFIAVAKTRAAIYRQARAFEAWVLLHDLLLDLRAGAREKGMLRTEHLPRLELSPKILDELADVLYKEMEDRGIDIDSAFDG